MLCTWNVLPGPLPSGQREQRPFSQNQISFAPRVYEFGKVPAEEGESAKSLFQDGNARQGAANCCGSLDTSYDSVAYRFYLHGCTHRNVIQNPPWKDVAVCWNSGKTDTLIPTSYVRNCQRL